MQCYMTNRKPFVSTGSAVLSTFGRKIERKERKKIYASSKKAASINKGKGATWEEKPFTRKDQGGQ